jgi:tetratricopeptide (TPR) repeat protein
MRAILSVFSFSPPPISCRFARLAAFIVLGGFLSPVASPLRAQSDPAVNEKFRKATEAMRAGKLEEAGDGFSEVIKAAPDFAEAFLNLGLVLEEQGHNEDAISYLKKALALKPRMRGANLFLGVAEFRLNHSDRAVDALKKETSASPKDANAWMWLGVAQLVAERPEEAADSLDKAAKLDPANVDILYHRGRAHLLVSKNSYEKMFKVDPHSWRVHQVLGQMSSEADRHEDAILQYQAAISLVPTQPGLHEELAGEYYSSSRFPEAAAAYGRELEIDPHNAVARYRLGILKMETGDAARGKSLIEAALRETPALADADYNLGRAEMLLGNDETAVSHFRKATQTETDPDVLQQAWYQLGTVLRRMHRTQEAQEAFAIFQNLKDQQLEESQKQLKKFQRKGDSDAVAPVPTSDQPGNQ